MLEFKNEPKTLSELENQLEEERKRAGADKNRLSVNGLAARELYEMKTGADIAKDVQNEQKINELISNLEITDMEFLAKMQAEIKDLHEKELKPVNVPKTYKLIVKAWAIIKKNENNPKINKVDLGKKKEFFQELYQRITANPEYRKMIPELQKMDKLH